MRRIEAGYRYCAANPTQKCLSEVAVRLTLEGIDLGKSAQYAQLFLAAAGQKESAIHIDKTRKELLRKSFAGRVSETEIADSHEETMRRYFDARMFTVNIDNFLAELSLLNSLTGKGRASVLGNVAAV
ncbi:MAG: hypothetical protein FJX29_14100, partial [Alphaproteobacteria bacterium]|nr:hypothetical protein [Alphaproteobacteria bacterium]